MKKNYTLTRILLICSLCITMSTARAQNYVSIPDSNFGNWLYNNGYAPDMAGGSTTGWQLDVQSTDVLSATQMFCIYANISDLTGVEYFPSLIWLDCSANLLTVQPNLPQMLTNLSISSNPLTSLGGLPASIQVLHCEFCQIQTIGTLPDSLRTFYCGQNFLSILPVLPAHLQLMDCSYNHLSSLPVLPASLTTLYCAYDSLPSLPALPASLSYLDCSFDSLSVLPALPASLRTLNCMGNELLVIPTLPDSLRSMSCDQNLITALPTLHDSLTYLSCSSNLIASLPALPAHLQQLNCSGNPITSLPSLPASLSNLSCSSDSLVSLPPLPASLTGLDCSYNFITTLPVLPAGLAGLYCGNNLISSIPYLPPAINSFSCYNNSAISCLPRVYKDSLQNFYISGTSITCLPNRFLAQYGDYNQATFPLCDPTTGCDFYYNIAGNIHYDTATTCTSDSLYPSSPINRMKVQLLQGGTVIQQFYSFTSGGYSFQTPSLSTYTVDIDTVMLPISVVCPASSSRTVTLIPTDSVEKFESFGMQCSSVDFGVQNIYGSHFRPEHSSQIDITAGNYALLNYNANCGAGVSGTVTTTLYGSVRYAGPAVGALTPSSVIGNILTYNVSNLDNLGSGSLSIIVSTDTNAVVGSAVCITVNVNPSVPDINPVNNTLTQCFSVVNSWDPNDKEVYPLDTFRSGQWLTYSVTFQNTGTDTAYLVVVRDLLSQDIDASSFQYLASSAKNVVIQLFGNAMVFTFPHINLVDSLRNPQLSTGWIEYKVRSKSNLPLGTQVLNKAAIYFDNNPAVITNTTVNIVDTMVRVTCSDTAVGLRQSICYGDTFVFGSRLLTASGTYVDTLRRAGGCDSIIYLSLTLRPLSYDTISWAICQGDSFTFGSRHLTASGTYRDTLTSAGGCDSILVLNLNVNPLPMVTLSWNSLVASQVLWVFGTHSDTAFVPVCSPIIFAMHGGYPVGGIYSGRYIHGDTATMYLNSSDWGTIDTVIYTYTDSNQCKNTASDSLLLDGPCEGINEVSNTNSIHLYPNPNKGSFTLQTLNSIGATYTISDMLGNVIAQKITTADTQIIDVKDAAEGVYTLVVKGATPVRFVVVR